MIRARPVLTRLPRVEHGGPTGDERARKRAILDFSVCTNPYGPAPCVRDAIARAEIDRYPDPTSSAARTAIGSCIREPIQHVIVGAGAAELIHAACLAFVRSGDRVVVPPHAFAEYERAAVIAGAHVPRPQSRSIPVSGLASEMASMVTRLRPRLTFVCVPESPSGRSWTIGDVQIVADACERTGSLLVLDQSYDAFATRPLGSPALRGHPAVLHIRSLTKEHALPGTRVAFGVASSSICDAVNRVRVPWSVSAHAQAATLACMTAEANAHASETVSLVRGHSHDLATFLRTRGWNVHPSDTHYFLLDVGNATEFRDGLMARHGIRVRDATSFGFPHSIRVAPGTPERNAVLMSVLSEMTPPVLLTCNG
jgi:histidinol-phosphate/aromatic aminotransferase/cobyric acid decarboxylase-like protein